MLRVCLRECVCRGEWWPVTSADKCLGWQMCGQGQKPKHESPARGMERWRKGSEGGGARGGAPVIWTSHYSPNLMTSSSHLQQRETKNIHNTCICLVWLKRQLSRYQTIWNMFKTAEAKVQFSKQVHPCRHLPVQVSFPEVHCVFISVKKKKLETMTQVSGAIF